MIAGRRETVVGNEEGRQGATLLHPPTDVNPVRRDPPKEGGHLDRGEGPFDKVPKPRRKPDPTEDMADPVMVNRVKGFRRVKEEEEPVVLPGDGFVEEGVNIDDVVTPVFP